MNNSQHDTGLESIRLTRSIQLSQFQKEDSMTAARENMEEQDLVNLGVEASQRWSNSRQARLAKLRSMIEAGTYEVKSGELAECMVKNETHFFSVEAH